MTFFFLKKLAVIAAKPETTPPINAVASINKYGLSIFNMINDTLCARICSLWLLIQKLSTPHNKNNARKPVRKLMPALWGINAATIKATIAMLHHGKYRQAAKLNSAIRIIDDMNFICLTLVPSPAEREAGPLFIN